MYGKKRKTQCAVHVLNLFCAEEKQQQIKRKGLRKKAVIASSLASSEQVIGKDDNFSVFRDDHMEAAAKIIGVLLRAPTFSKFVSLCEELRGEINERLYIYCVAVATAHRRDSRDFNLPPIFQTQGREFFKNKVLGATYDAVQIHGTNDNTTAASNAPIVRRKASKRHDEVKHVVQAEVKPGSGDGAAKVKPGDGDGAAKVKPGDGDGAAEVKPESGDDDKEYLLDYFREDICINSHHWHWHVIYPVGVPEIELDRRGELFYYMHRQMLARYDSERFSNGLAPVKPLYYWSEGLKEGYNPDLAGRRASYAIRRPRMELSQGDKDTLQGLRSNIQFDGPGVTIDTLGNQVEGGLHNRGHVIISGLQNDSTPFGSPGGVMAYTETAIRDPIFFRWHKYIDGLFREFQDGLDAYSDEELTWSGVTLDQIEVLDDRLNATDILYTFMRSREIDLSYSLDLRSAQSNQVTVTHLDHHAFSYRLSVTNKTSQPQWATVRIFLVPEQNEHKAIHTMADYQTKSIEMDRFTQRIPVGNYTFERASSDSSVTIPWEQSFDVLYQNTSRETDSQRNVEDYCGCGWPEHVQLPRGTRDGMPFNLVVMLTDWEEDKVYQSRKAPAHPEDLILRSDTGELKSCKNAASYCGRRDRLYPDKQTMGFPFDRPLKPQSLKIFTKGKSNINFKKLNIVDTDTIINYN